LDEADASRLRVDDSSLKSAKNAAPPADDATSLYMTPRQGIGQISSV